MRIAEGGSRSWVLKIAVDGKRRELGLGSAAEVSLAEAKKRAEVRRQEARSGERVAANPPPAVTMTFQAAATAYIAAHRAEWSSAKHAAQWQATLATYAFPVFGNNPVQAIDRPAILRVLEPIWTTKPETANRLRGRIEAVLDWAAVQGHRQGDNPARWKGHLEHLLADLAKVRQQDHHAAIPYAEMPAFMARLRRVPTLAARALILTAARSGEVLGATWRESIWARACGRSQPSA